MATVCTRHANTGTAPAWFEIAAATDKTIHISGDEDVALQFTDSTPAAVNLETQATFRLNDPRALVANPDVKTWLLIGAQKSAVVVKSTVAPAETGFIVQRVPFAK